MAGSVPAMVLLKPRTLVAREFARPVIGPDDALLRIEACGICGSDYEQYEGAQPPHEDYTPYPVIPGHEPLGVIAEIGAEARLRWGVDEGDRVAVRSGYGCGHCEACGRGEPRACPRRGGTYGYTDVGKPPHLWGGYAEHMYLCPHSVVKKMDPSIPAAVAVMFNPLAAGLSWAASVPGTGPGDRVVILGAGQRGLCCVIGARAAGASWSPGSRGSAPRRLSRSTTSSTRSSASAAS
jgi:threonine dehydrogenase-like Zn-dependent dehydrogenase